MKKLKIENVIKTAQKYGHDVTIRDVTYGLLRSVFNNELMCYTVVFGSPQLDDDIECYERLEKFQYLLKFFTDKFTANEREASKNAIVEQLTKQNEKSVQAEKEITFEENKAEMTKLIDRVEEGIATGTIEPDKGLKIIADIRVKLNDKFKVEETTDVQYIVVNKKYNAICEHTHRECFLQTKEYAKEHWHLIDDPNYSE
jgi:hypothetical protein